MLLLHNFGWILCDFDGFLCILGGFWAVLGRILGEKPKIFEEKKFSKKNFMLFFESWWKMERKFFSCCDFDSNFLVYFGPKNTYAFSARAQFPLDLARKSPKILQNQWKISENQWKLTYIGAKPPLFPYTVPGIPILMVIKCFSVDSEWFYVVFQWFWWLLVRSRMENHSKWMKIAVPLSLFGLIVSQMFDFAYYCVFPCWLCMIWHSFVGF